MEDKHCVFLLFIQEIFYKQVPSEFALNETQNYFYALDLHKKEFKPVVDDGFNLLKIHIREAEQDGALDTRLYL